MKRIFLLIVVPALLVAMAFAQTPAASGNSDQINVKGCLGGSEGNYTVAEDNTGNIFKITTGSTDLKAYVGQDVNLTGHKTGTAESSLTVTALNMISEHCTAAAAAPAAAVSAPSDTVSTPPAAPAAPEATVSAPADTMSTPVAAAPEGTVSTPAETSAPPALAADLSTAAPSATVSSPVEAASSPAAAAPVHRAQPAARPQKPAATAAAAAAPPEPASKPAQDTAVPVADAPATRVDSSSDTATTPAAPAAAPKTSAIRSAGMLVTIVVVLLIGAGVPLYNRWRRRRVAEQTKGQNLSFTKEAKSDPGKSDTTGGRKAA